MPEIWPTILVPSSEDWAPRGGARSGGVTFQGQEQIVVSPTARWRASLTIPCLTPAHVLAMRRVIALGRSAAWLIGPCEVTRAPWFVDPLTGARITYGRGAKDAVINSAFGSNPDTSSALDFRLAEVALTNATTLTIQRNRGGFLLPGMTLSIDDRLHVISGVTTVDPTDPDTGQAAPGRIGIQIRPWLRADHGPTTILEFGRPLGTMGLASDDTGAMELQLSRFGTVTVELAEKFA